MKKLTQLPKILTKQRFKKPIYAYWQFWLLVFVLSLGAWQASIYIEQWGDGARERAMDAWMDNWIAQREAKDLAIKAAYEADTYGGKTPQETWDMFIQALEAGDTDLAAKYFIVEKQEEERESWKKAKERGFIQLFLNDFRLIKGYRMYDNGMMFEFYTDDIDGGPGFVYTLVLNKQTNIWKIYDL